MQAWTFYCNAQSLIQQPCPGFRPGAKVLSPDRWLMRERRALPSVSWDQTSHPSSHELLERGQHGTRQGNVSTKRVRKATQRGGGPYAETQR